MDWSMDLISGYFFFDYILIGCLLALCAIAAFAMFVVVLGYFGIRKHDANWNVIHKELSKRYESIGRLQDSLQRPDLSTPIKSPTFLDWILRRVKHPASTPASPNPSTRTASSKHPVSDRMMLIDIIVEKAQRKLSERSASYFATGFLLFSFSGILVLMFSAFLFYNSELSFGISYHLLEKTPTFQACLESMPDIGKSEESQLHASAPTPIKTSRPTAGDDPLSPMPGGSIKKIRCYEIHKTLLRSFPSSFEHSEWFVFIIEVLKRITAGGAILGVAYIIAATANSCFRESTILLHRRHLLRYIRLMSYEKNGNIDHAHLRDIFGVDEATRTGFDNVKTESLKDNLVSKLIEAIGMIGSNSKVSVEASEKSKIEIPGK